MLRTRPRQRRKRLTDDDLVAHGQEALDGLEPDAPVGPRDDDGPALAVLHQV